MKEGDIVLYPKNAQKALDPALFENPTSEYRGTPFWAWNCDMTPEMLTRQIDILQEMGLGGFHMHSRSGMAVPYLSDRFMDLVKVCVEKARENKMLAWLYDEDRWPSGAAGGLVTRDHAYRSRSLLFTTASREGQTLAAQANPQSIRPGLRTEAREGQTPAARYGVTLDKDGFLVNARRLSDSEAEAMPGETLWNAYICVAEDSPWYNNQAYLDTLSEKAVRRFIEVTHERYAQCVGKDFGGIVPAIFTDEPQFSRKKTLGFAHSKADVSLPWTDDLPETFAAAYGTDLWDGLPELFFDLPDGKPSTVRYHYHAHISDRFAGAFADQIGAWCEKHNLLLTGHMMEEPTLESQTEALGEVMRSLSGFQLPGIDMLCDRYEYTTAKQAQSVAHQYGREGVLSELYGVTGWHYDFRGHKLQGDWQAALGITVRVQHLSWVSMRGPAKRDYPASISYQSPWYKEYPLIENHFARLNTALVRGKAAIRVAMVHPVESYWLLYGPKEQTHAQREELDTQFQNITDWLLNGLIDFNYLSEALLPAQCARGNAPLAVGKMAYDVVLVPACKTLRGTTVERLEAFADAGGTLLFVGEIPSLVDAVPSDRVQKLAAKARAIPFQKTAILGALEPWRAVDVRDESGIRPEFLLQQMREDGEDRWLFLCNGRPAPNPDLPAGRKLTVKLNGTWKPTLYDTMTGDIRPLPCAYADGKTVLTQPWNVHDSLLLRLEPGMASASAAQAAPARGEERRFEGLVDVTLSEPNVLLLDRAEYAFDDGPWQPRAEILEIDRRFREQIGYTSRGGHLPQPWVTPEVASFEHFLRLRFAIQSGIRVESPKLAIESPELCQTWLNGKPVALEADGWFVDEAIETCALPPILPGENVLEIRMPIGQRLGPEWCYLLGDFGVALHGTDTALTEPVRKLGFGNWAAQGLPFYAGNVTYHLPVETGGRFLLKVPQYRNPLLTVALDGERRGTIVFAPYELALETTPGAHRVDLTAYGNRANAFGSVHNANPQERWLGPGAWQSKGDAWCDEYNLWPTGVLISPRVYEI